MATYGAGFTLTEVPQGAMSGVSRDSVHYFFNGHYFPGTGVCCTDGLNETLTDHRNIKRRIKLVTGFKSFRGAQTLLAGIELIHMMRKGQLGHPDGEGVSPAEQFYLLATRKTGNATFAELMPLTRHSPLQSVHQKW